MEGIKELDYKIGLLSIKLIPVAMFLIMWLHTGLLLFNIKLPIADTIAGSALFPSILILSISRMLKFCWIHKSLTIYSLLVDTCINYHRYIGFSNLLFYHRLMYFIVGLVLFIFLAFNFNKYLKGCVNLKSLVYYVRNYKEFTTQSNK